MYKRKCVTLYGVGCSEWKKNETVRKETGEDVEREIE
jgi:hypothetical protein